MWEIWANQLMPQALKSCPNFNKSPDLVTLFVYLQGPTFQSSNVYHQEESNLPVQVSRRQISSALAYFSKNTFEKYFEHSTQM